MRDTFARRVASCALALVVAACTAFGSGNDGPHGAVADASPPDDVSVPEGGSIPDGGGPAPAPEACEDMAPTCGVVQVMRFDAPAKPADWTEHVDKGTLRYDRAPYCGSAALHAVAETTKADERARAYVAKTVHAGAVDEIKLRFAVREPAEVRSSSVEYGCGVYAFDAQGAETNVRFELSSSGELQLDGESSADEPNGRDIPIQRAPGEWRLATMHVTFVPTADPTRPALRAATTYGGVTPAPLTIEMPAQASRIELRCGILTVDGQPGAVTVDVDDVQIEICADGL